MSKTKRIIIIDPDPVAALEYASFLSAGGYDVAVCKKITDAVPRIKEVQFDCAVVDVELEDMKGYDAVDILKTIDPQIEVILTANENSMELEAKVRTKDIFYYHIKSFNNEELMMAIHNVFNKEEREDKMKNGRQRSKILVIDDDHDFLKSIQVILESASYEFVSADDPKEAMEKVKSENPDLILMDIMMDSLFDGFSMCHTLKTTKEYRAYHHTPIIFISAVKDKAGSRFAFTQSDYGIIGPDDYIDKPVEPGDLLARIEKLLAK